MKTLFAFTPNVAPYPPFFNLSRDGDDVVLTLRGDASRDLNGAVMEGPTATARFNAADFHAEMMKAARDADA